MNGGTGEEGGRFAIGRVARWLVGVGGGGRGFWEGSGVFLFIDDAAAAGEVYLEAFC